MAFTSFHFAIHFLFLDYVPRLRQLHRWCCRLLQSVRRKICRDECTGYQDVYIHKSTSYTSVEILEWNVENANNYIFRRVLGEHTLSAIFSNKEMMANRFEVNNVLLVSYELLTLFLRKFLTTRRKEGESKLSALRSQTLLSQPKCSVWWRPKQKFNERQLQSRYFCSLDGNYFVIYFR